MKKPKMTAEATRKKTASTTRKKMATAMKMMNRMGKQKQDLK